MKFFLTKKGLKKIIAANALLIVFSLLIFGFLGVQKTSAETHQPGTRFVPISPIQRVTETEDGNVPKLEDYLNDLFVFSVGAAALLALVQISYGGFLWVVSSSSGKIEQGRKRITDALKGLALLLATYIILNQINPELTKFKLEPNQDFVPADSQTGEQTSVNNQNTQNNE